MMEHACPAVRSGPPGERNHADYPNLQWVISLTAQAAPAMRRHASAQARQACAHAWQWSIGCLPHSSPHAVSARTPGRKTRAT